MKDIPLVEIPMSVRLDNILRKAGYKTIYEIDDEALNNIRLIKGCGKKSFIELKNIVTAYCLDKQYRSEQKIDNVDNKQEEKNEFDFNQYWEQVVISRKKVEKLYEEFVKASDELAYTMLHDEDFVLGRLLPKTRRDRRDKLRVVSWVNSRKDKCYEWVMEERERIEKNLAREALISSLGLTQEQLAILQEECK